MSAADKSGGRRMDWIIDDGAILKAAFFAMLAGTAAVLTIDYLDLNQAAHDPQSAIRENPVLPAVHRPEIDENDPAFRPLETITTPREVLSAPLEMELVAGGVLVLSGTITPGAAQDFAEEVARRGDYIETVALNSPGGSVEDALAIGALIREKGYNTAVGDGALCASSCPLVLAGGVERIISNLASIGVHQIYTGGAEASALAPAQAMSDAQTVTARIARYLVEMGVDNGLWLHAMETPPDKLYYLTGEELESYRLSS